MKKTSLLGNLTPAQFMRDYWQKKPLLIRQAIPGFEPVIGVADLNQLALRDDVESRLVAQKDGLWSMQQGPLASLPPPAQKQWAMQVQGVNLYHAGADALLRQFRFVSDARLDDLTISFAGDGGGVGPHSDASDVFLLQGHGRQRWRIGPQKDTSLVKGLPLKILSKFEPDEEYVLEPGDMLYLPPHYAHEGVAVGACQTYSIGLRCPSYQELGEAFLEFMADSIDLPGRYSDAQAAPARHPAEIPRHMLASVAEEMNKVRFTDDDVLIFLGEHLSRPKHHVFFIGPARPLTAPRFAQSAAKKGLRLSPKTIMLYRNAHVFINGESFAIGRADKDALAVLANERALGGAASAAASGDVAEALYTWYRDGWLELG
jgi:50S ribosomal protein L16 3-hydroxylase